MKKINMLSSADKVPGQGVGSAYLEQVELVREGLKDTYEVVVNKNIKHGIDHYHTIDLKHYLKSKLEKHNPKVGYVHFLPETVDGSIKLPSIFKNVFYKYIISFYKSMDYLVTVNPCFIEKLEKYGIDREKIFYIPNYVSKEKFYTMSQYEIELIKIQYNLGRKDFVVLGVGQIQTRKGVKDFIEIARENKDVKFIWAGGFSFGKITDGYDELKEIVNKPPANVQFIGIVDREKMNAIYNMSNLLFMPSYNELFPMSILESMNCEKPLLLRDLDVYENILNKYYLKGKNNREFSTIIQLLKNNNSFYKEAVDMSKKGGQFYSKEHVLKLWNDFYNMVFLKKESKILNATLVKR